MKNKSNSNQVNLLPLMASDAHLGNCISGQQAYMYINKENPQDSSDQKVLNRSELINRILQMEGQDNVIELTELIHDVEHVAHRKIKLSTYNAQFDIIANEAMLLEVMKYMFVHIPSDMIPEVRFTVGFGMGSVQIQFNDELTNHASTVELVELFMKQEKGYVWMVGKTLHLVFQVHNKLMAA